MTERMHEDERPWQKLADEAAESQDREKAAEVFRQIREYHYPGKEEGASRPPSPPLADILPYGERP